MLFVIRMMSRFCVPDRIHLAVFGTLYLRDTVQTSVILERC